MSFARQFLVNAGLAFVSLLFLLYPAADRICDSLSSLVYTTPDFSKFVDIGVVHPENFAVDDENRRVIIVGDIHGMHEKLLELLSKLSFDPSSDFLVSVGDILAKGPHSGSMAVLDFMASNNVTAVRGNHDQKVIEWHGWLKWIKSLKGGEEWLHHAIQDWQKAQKRGEKDIEDWVNKKMKHDTAHKKWWKRVPRRWQFLGDHFKIAMDMSTTQYEYLASLPLKLHAPHAHAFIVHAGLLASDPNYKPTHSRQPLAAIPKIPKHLASSTGNSTLAYLRRFQEVGILNNVPQNVIPWNVLNMRGVTRKTHRVTRDKEGSPWSKLYKKDMSMCAGFESEFKGTLPCMPATVIYGHAASRGLDIKRWSIGLDTGCVYNRRLTALVLGGKDNTLLSGMEDDFLLDRPIFSEHTELEDDLDDEYDNLDEDTLRQRNHRKIRFGDDGWGRIVSIKC